MSWAQRLNRVFGIEITDLRERLARKYSAVFGPEKRSVGGIERIIDPDGFNFLDVGDGGPEEAKPAKAGALPFFN